MELVTNPKPAFSFKPSNTESSIFSGSPQSSGSVFGGSTDNTSLFGGNTTNTPFKPSGSLFGSKESPGGSIFGKAAETSLFGKAADPSSLFGKTSDAATPVFSKTSESSPGLFGKAKQTTPFGKPVADSSKPVFGSSLFGSSTSSNASNSKDSNSGTGLFGKSQESFQPDSTSGSVFGCGSKSTAFDFTSLAEKSGPGFSTASEGFTFAGSGTALFTTPKKDDDNEEDINEDDGHDPHFEPIVPLPELVETKTGEEEEQIGFKHRAKVYRYCGDSKQWKERGVGDIKILKHPVNSVTRVLLRRDQVHKIALNHRITKEMELKNLASSETAWCWYAMDFSEGNEESGTLEHLAVRFKHKDVAEDFKEKFETCQSDINLSATESPVKLTSKDENEHQYEQNEAYEGYDDEDDYDENEESVMFHQTAILYVKNDDTEEFMSQGEVDLRIVYDDDVYGARILAEGPTSDADEDNTICNHLIAMQTALIDGPQLER